MWWKAIGNLLSRTKSINDTLVESDGMSTAKSSPFQSVKNQTQELPEHGKEETGPPTPRRSPAAENGQLGERILKSRSRNLSGSALEMLSVPR